MRTGIAASQRWLICYTGQVLSHEDEQAAEIRLTLPLCDVPLSGNDT